jgi:hypothetical protein
MQDAIKKHCEERDIRIITLPSGAVRFLGDGVDLLVANTRTVSVSDLTPYTPRKGRALRNV